jgi:DcaP outer membrane protein
MVTLIGACLCTQLAVAIPMRQSAAASSDLAAIEALIETLREQLEEQRSLIAKNAEELAAQRATIDALQRRLADGATPKVAAPAQAASPASDQRVDPELPHKFVGEGEFPGSIEIPGTDTAFKIGGQARATLVHSLTPLGEDDRFITSSIPVGVELPGEQARATYTAAPSRINFEFRSPTRFGGLRTFVEYDFSGANHTASLRHAFMQANRWLFGQTWSTFSDPEAQPTDIDFEGLNAISLFRQAQIRYTRPVRDTLSLSLAVENPSPDLTGAAGVNLTPDFVARLRWDPPKPVTGITTNVAHVQTAALVRTLRGAPAGATDSTLSTSGFGVNVSGVLIPKWDRAGRIKFSTNNGWGIGRYIKDLEALGGQDAVYDPTLGQLRALGVSSAYIGFERQWRSWLQSAFTYGVVKVANLDIQPDNALRRTQRASFSVSFMPIRNSELITEFLLGERVNKDGARGDASQFQAGWKWTY